MDRPAARSPSPPRPAGQGGLRRKRDPIAFTAGARYEGTGVFKEPAAGVQTVQNPGRGRSIPALAWPTFTPGKRRDIRCPAPGS